MTEKPVAVVPVEPGTFVRMFPERHPDGKYYKDTKWNGKILYFEGHPAFEVASFILDRSGTYVTFERADGTFYLRGEFDDVKFPFPHPMFEIVDEAEAAQFRAQKDRARAILRAEYAKRRWYWPFSIRWPDWLRLRTLRCDHT